MQEWFKIQHFITDLSSLKVLPWKTSPRPVSRSVTKIRPRWIRIHTYHFLCTLSYLASTTHCLVPVLCKSVNYKAIFNYSSPDWLVLALTAQKCLFQYLYCILSSSSTGRKQTLAIDHNVIFRIFPVSGSKKWRVWFEYNAGMRLEMRNWRQITYGWRVTDIIP